MAPRRGNRIPWNRIKMKMFFYSLDVCYFIYYYGLFLLYYITKNDIIV